jgi:hypothetical protein
MKNENQLIQQLSLPGGENRKRLVGGGRKVSNFEIEKELTNLVKEMNR